MQLKRPFLRLPFSFDADVLAREAKALDPDAWLAHPSRMQGNSAVPLIARHGEANNHFDGPMKQTSHLLKCEYLQQVIGSFDEVFGRSRLMKLDPNSEVSQHIDFNYHWHKRVRIHIPVITNPEVRFHCGDSEIHMQPGECWLFDSWRRHRVVNSSARHRIHLVLDMAGSSKFWSMVHQLESEPVSQNEVFPILPYKAGMRVEIKTERYNVAPVMSPGEVDGLVEEIIQDFTAQKSNEASRVLKYEKLLRAFACDWRTLWHTFGPRREGFKHYHQLIETTQRQLHPDRRALTTASNNAGVNPIIVQRILRAALVPELNEVYDAKSNE